MMTAVTTRPSSPSPIPLRERGWIRADASNIWTSSPKDADLAHLFAGLELLPVIRPRPRPRHILT